jgi:PKHD-type hydroxylase
MILCIADVLDPELLSAAEAALGVAEFADGRETAGWHARTVKRNVQARAGGLALATLRDRLADALKRNDVFRSAVLPRTLRALMFSRYETGMSYGTHVDDAIMSGPEPLRSDVSVTLFVSPPDSYDGGELVIEMHGGEEAYKLAAGHAIVYPSTTLHRVETVTRGRRDVAVGWVQSLVRDVAQREVLFDLDTARRALFQRHGKTREFDQLSRTYSNLLRMWADL